MYQSKLRLRLRLMLEVDLEAGLGLLNLAFVLECEPAHGSDPGGEHPLHLSDGAGGAFADHFSQGTATGDPLSAPEVPWQFLKRRKLSPWL